MLRPSRPMMRPFISSVGRGMVAVVALIGAVACITLDRGDHEFLRFAFGALFGFIKRIADQDSAFVFHFAFEFS